MIRGTRSPADLKDLLDDLFELEGRSKGFSNRAEAEQANFSGEPEERARASININHG